MSHNSALASLTAQYTDSENEDDQHADDSDSNSSGSQGVLVEQRPRSVTPLVPTGANNASAAMSTQSMTEPHSITVRRTAKKSKRKKLARLVSYNDDTIDENGDHHQHSSSDEEDDEDDDTHSDSEDGSHRNGSNGALDGNDDASSGGTLDLAASAMPGDSTSGAGHDRTGEFGFSLPPEPKGRCPADLQEKIASMYAKMRAGMDMNRLIQDRKEFRNPSIYEKLIQFCDINELGTNYPPEIYDPLQWGRESFYEELALLQKTEMERRERERKESQKNQLVLEAVRKAEEEAKRRKSKWDQPAPGVAVAAATALQVAKAAAAAAAAAGLVQTNATGTKGTVISAFGSLPKKPKA